MPYDIARPLLRFVLLFALQQIIFVDKYASRHTATTVQQLTCARQLNKANNTHIRYNRKQLKVKG